jgi:hypothetical protein
MLISMSSSQSEAQATVRSCVPDPISAGLPKRSAELSDVQLVAARTHVGFGSVSDVAVIRQRDRPFPNVVHPPPLSGSHRPFPQLTSD